MDFMHRYQHLFFILLMTALFSTIAFAQDIAPPSQDYVLRFAGEQYAVAPDNPALDLGSEFTMMGWFYFEKVTPGAILMGRLHNPWTEDPGVAYTLGVTNFDENNEFEFLLSDGTPESRTFLFGGAIPENQWVHVAVTFGSQTMRIYANGEEKGSTPFAGTPDVNATRFGIGGSVTEEVSIGYQSGFSGFMKQVSVWNTALSESAIATYAESGLTGSEVDLVAYWVLNDAPESNVAIDATSNSLDLRFDQNYHRPQWKNTWPLIYREEAIANPYFEVHEIDWFTQVNGLDYVTADVYLLDLKNDGLLDAVVSNSYLPATYPETPVPLHALSNNGGLNFIENTAEILGEVEVILPRFGAVADFNNDGLDDLYLADSGTDTPPIPGHQNAYFLQRPDGTLSNESETKIPLINNANHGLTVGDIDNDGDIDIITAQQGRCCDPGITGSDPEIFINDGSGNFTLENNRWPASDIWKDHFTDPQITSAVLIDWDRDGDLDLFLGAAYSSFSEYWGRSALLLLFNDGTGHFEFPNPNQSVLDNEFSVYEQEGSFHTYVDLVATDINADGRTDLVGSYIIDNYQGGGLSLYINDRNMTGTKTENAFPANGFNVDGNDYWLVYSRAMDFNNDGWVDIYSEGGIAGDYLFLNNGDNTFTNFSEVLYTKTMQWNSTSNVGDLDNDGDVDIFSVTNGSIQILENKRSYATTTSTVQKPLAPALTAPDDSSEVPSTTMLAWEEDSPFALSHVQVAKDSDFADIIFERKEYTGLQIELSGLIDGTEYFWRVRGKNTAGFSAWSAAQTFAVNTSVAIQEANPMTPTTFRLYANYPNPFNPSTEIRYQLPVNSKVSLKVFDMLGREVATLVDGRVSAGQHEIHFDASALSSGLYIYRLQAGEFIETKKMMLIK